MTKSHQTTSSIEPYACSQHPQASFKLILISYHLFFNLLSGLFLYGLIRYVYHDCVNLKKNITSVHLPTTTTTITITTTITTTTTTNNNNNNKSTQDFLREHERNSTCRLKDNIKMDQRNRSEDVDWNRLAKDASQL